jgi:hypothetical protein
MFAEGKKATYFDLESQPDFQRLQNPELMLGSLNGIVILDEIQIMPELFNVLRVLADRPKNRTRFLVLGSASPGIISGIISGQACYFAIYEIVLPHGSETATPLSRSTVPRYFAW